MEAGGRRGHGEVLVGAGRSGGGDESVGVPFVEAFVETLAAAGSRCVPSSSSSSSVSMTPGSGAAAVSARRLLNTIVFAAGVWMEPAVGASRWPLTLPMGSDSAEVWLWRGLRCSMEAQEEEEEEEGRGRSGGEAGRLMGFSFSIMVVESRGGNLSAAQ